MKTKLLLVVIALFTLTVKAQFDVTQNIIIDDTFGHANPEKVYSADLDGDNFKDIISLGNDIFWYKNLDGQGNYGRAILIVDFETSGYWIDMDVADLDGDNDNDIVFFDESENRPLVWMENLDGLGNFGAPQTIKAITSNSTYISLKIEVTDMDSDGDMDIAYSDIDGISWFENTDGTANFTDHLLIGLTQTNLDDPRDFVAADFDGDNLQDIIIDNNQSIDFYKHNMDGTASLIQNLDGNALGKNIISADVDGDGDNDLVSVLADDSNSKIEWFQNLNGLGAFAAKNTLISLGNFIDANIYYDFAIEFADVDNDSALDIVFSNQITQDVVWYKNFGSGNFGNEITITTSTYLSNKEICLSDVDGDNIVDIVTSSSDESQVSWHKNLDGLGNFSEQNPISEFVYGINNFVKADLDRDGNVDLITGSEYDGKIAWYRNVDGLGGFTEKQKIVDNSLNIVREVYSKDIDLDGDMDILAFGHTYIFYEPSRITAYFNDGDANFTEQTLLDVNGRLDHLIVDDIDGDYDADLIGVINNNDLYRKINNGDGTFGDVEIIASNLSSNPTDIKFIDYDNDEDFDIIISHANGDFSLYSNTDGQGTYSLMQTISDEATNPNFLYIADINTDGNMDLLFRDNSSEIVYMLGIDGQGTFDSKVVAVSTSANFVSGIYVVDMDNDRDLDIVSSTYFGSNDNQVVWFENFGNLNFGPAIEIANNIGQLKHVDAFDIDNNGSLDLITATGDFQLMWLENLGFNTNEINGIVKLDENNNGCDESDVPIANSMVIADNGIEQYATFTNFNGIYQLFIEEPGDYVTSFAVEFPDYFEATPISYSSNLDQLGTTENLDFCIEQTAEIVYDLELSIIPFIEDPRPGFDTSYRIVFINKGSFPESGTITFEYEGAKLQFQSATEAVANLAADEIMFNFEDLSPFETRFIDLTFTVFQPPTVNDGDLLDFFATADGGNNDVTPVNNSHGIKQFVVNSYDPNDIRVMEGPEIFIEDIDNYLHYVIRFQNTGSASAININVEHQLDDQLNWSTMQLLSLSHAGRVEITDGSMVNFIFDDIHLPDSTTNEPASHGHIAYKIKPKSNVEVGDIFNGVADIYFDFNPPIITNTVNTEIVEPLSVDEFEFDAVKLYPNPAKDKIEIASNQIIDRLHIIDINGRVLNKIELSTLNYSLDVSDLSKGVYFLEIKSGDSKTTKKFIKN